MSDTQAILGCPFCDHLIDIDSLITGHTADYTFDVCDTCAKSYLMESRPWKRWCGHLGECGTMWWSIPVWDLYQYSPTEYYPHMSRDSVVEDPDNHHTAHN